MTFSDRTIPPVAIIPWQNDFLQALLRYVTEHTDGETGRAVIVFPHSRPRRYLLDLFRTSPDIPRPCLIPQILPVSEFLSAVSTAGSTAQPRTIELLDRVGLLLECVRELGIGEQPPSAGEMPASATFTPRGPLSALPLTDARRFFPWGMRLAALLEDFYNQGLEPDDYHYMEGDVVDFAARLLEQLGSIHRLYTGRLDAENWTTPGYDAFRAAHAADSLPAMFAGKIIFIAGFYGLTGVEKKVFTTLRSACGAHMVLHTDPALAAKKPVHWSCKEHESLLEQWQAGTVLLEEPEDRHATIEYHEGFDLHSQLDALQKKLTQTDSLEQSAVVLPDSGMLMPLLHHLPRKDVNISMGYPLGKSPLAQLLDTIMDLQEGRTPSGYPWRRIIDLIRHPYLKMLSLHNARPLQQVFRHMERSVRQGARHTDPRNLQIEYLAEADATGAGTAAVDDEALAALVSRIFDLTLTRWERVSTPQQLAGVLADMCTLLLEQGADMWKRFPVDAECMYRLMHRVIPALRESTVRDAELDSGLLYTILREVMNAERVPFEAEPLTGLQVMGMLEARLLRFRRVYVLDATENNLPGVPANDPLLPENLRGLLGLPDIRHRERVSAYNFFRLIKGAREVTLLYQAGTTQSGLFDEKKQRSRFLEELIWQDEQRTGRLLQAGTPPLHAVSYSIPAISLHDAVIPRSAAIDDRIRELLARPVSATMLDSYLRCPVSFFYERLCRIAPAEQVNEGDDHLGVGDLMHAVLQEFFTPYAGQEITRGQLDAKALTGLFHQRLHSSGLQDTLPYDSYCMLSVAGPERLTRFLNNQPETTRILKLEEALEAKVEAGGSTYWIAGRLDRVDERDGCDIVLDYKTGTARKPAQEVWKSEDLWEKIARWHPAAEDDPLPLLSDALRSIQLPFYLYLYATACGRPAGNAGWIALRDSGKEEMLFTAAGRDEVQHAAAHQIPAIIGFLLQHMTTSSCFRPRRGKHCDWCFYANLCTFRLEGPTG
jgi:hypothetical protein